MIESNIIDWIDFNDNIQNVDIYSKKIILIICNIKKFIKE